MTNCFASGEIFYLRLFLPSEFYADFFSSDKVLKVWLEKITCRYELFHDGGSYHIETNSLIYSANQWTEFFIIGKPPSWKSWVLNKSEVHRSTSAHEDTTWARREIPVVHFSLHKKWSFPLRVSSVNVTKYTGNCEFGHTCLRNS